MYCEETINTDRNVNLELTIGGGLESGVEDDAPKLYLAAGLVNRPVGLHEDGVALVHVLELG